MIATTARPVGVAVSTPSLKWQLRLDRYVPFVYWLTVVVLSVTGTLYTDILTDSLGVPLVVGTSVFAAVLAIVFGVWFARERTLSIHSIVTLPRELFYWLAVLVTFSLGTAAGGWILELNGWGPGTSVLLYCLDRDRLAAGRERCAVLLARLHSDPPAGCEPRRLVGVADGRSRPRFGYRHHQRDLPRSSLRSCTSRAPAATCSKTRAHIAGRVRRGSAVMVMTGRLGRTVFASVRAALIIGGLTPQQSAYGHPRRRHRHRGAPATAGSRGCGARLRPGQPERADARAAVHRP
jgi:hypothetical protein